ncbi:MAG: NUDIX domain-containing protein [Candidatus Aureabacteria bacterium]|nr:NUDIX domain-containing protein [Candidatus Auribacterota bacterium]
MAGEEIFDIVDPDTNRVLGQADRKKVHGNPSLVHQAVHVLVFNNAGHLYLQKRSPHKDIQPDKWDTSVGGHVQSGESLVEAVRRETMEELNICPSEFIHLYQYLMSNSLETELVNTYKIVYNDSLIPNPEEITEGRFWTPEEIERNLNQGVFTPNFEEEWIKYKEDQNDSPTH